MATIKIEAAVTGKVWKIEKQPGDQVAVDEAIVILESMKMEIPVEATSAGTVREIKVAEGDSVTEGQVVVIIES
jgi:acetyl-CoA carboxylase biotin carboxyl carrier protein